MKKIIQLKKNTIDLNSSDYLESYLLSMGIRAADMDSFLSSPSLADEDDPRGLENIEAAVKVAYEKLTAYQSVYIQPDSDADGYTSAAVLSNYLKRRFNSQIFYKVHPGKEHGINVDYVLQTCDLVFIPDAGSNDFAQQKELVAKGKTVIVLDHHEVENMEETGAYIVNNQTSPRFANKSLSGVGIVYMFIKLMDETYFSDDKIYQDYLDLTAVGMLADAMDTRSLGSHVIVSHGLKNIRSPLLKELIKRQERGIADPKNLKKVDVLFYVAPIINGMIRSGTFEEKMMLLGAMMNENQGSVEIHSEYRGKARVETLYENAARIASNAKSRQDAAKKKNLEALKLKIEKENLSGHNVLVVPLTKEESKNILPTITGLVAMDLVKAYNRPCMVLRETEDGNFMGSARNGRYRAIESLLDVARESELFNLAQGHGNAFGVGISKDNISKFLEYVDKTIDSEEFNISVHNVDYWFKDKEIIPSSMLFAFAERGELWGNGITKPLFAFDLDLDTVTPQVMGAKGTSVKLTNNNIAYVGLSNEQLVKDLEEAKKGSQITVIGVPQINEWMGRKTIQILIEDYEINTKEEEEKINIKEAVWNLI